MPHRNRVTPEGQIIADPARGTLMGNRGRLHGPDGQLGTGLWASKAWIACVLSFRGRRRTLLAPGSYTELFFLDEATACAAGHRPCAECRRADHSAFTAAWRDVHGPARSPGIDAALHAARVRRDRSKVTFAAEAAGLPDGTMIRASDGPALILGDTSRAWSPGGYGPPRPRPQGTVTVLTPEPMVAVFRAGYRPALHPSAA